MIFCADLHLRKNPPRSRVDDYWSAQEQKLRFILKLAQESPLLLVAGDFFDQARPGPFLERWIIELLKEYNVRPVVVPGQHDMPGHSLEQLPDSGLGVLAAAGVIELLIDPRILHYDENSGWYVSGCPYGQLPNITVIGHPGILLWHHMVINEPLWPGQEADKVHSILKKYPQFDLIVTGDNHQTFAICPVSKPDGTFKLPNRWLINPGSMMRQTAAQVNHHPCVFKWENGKLEQIFLPIEQGVLDLNDLERAKEKDSRISAFVEGLENQYEIGLSYNKNLEEHMRTNKVRPEIQKIVWGCLKNDK